MIGRIEGESMMVSGPKGINPAPCSSKEGSSPNMKDQLPSTKYDTLSLDVSFSSYRKEEEATQHNPPSLLQAKMLESANNRGNAKSRRRNSHDSEISVFEAENYFNATDNEDRNMKNSSVNGLLKTRSEKEKDLITGNVNPIFEQKKQTLRSMSFRGVQGRYVTVTKTPSTPASCSDTSSWASHSVLLRKPEAGVHNYNKNTNSRKKSGFYGYGFACRCPCAGKKAVDVEEPLQEPKAPLPSTTISCQSSPPYRYNPPSKPWNPSPNPMHPKPVPNNPPDGFSFPIMNKSQQSQTLNPHETHEKSPPLEIFDSPFHKHTNSTELQRNPVLLESRKSFTFSEMSEQKITSIEDDDDDDDDDDRGSDSSSDLFEIESFCPSYQRYGHIQSCKHMRAQSDELSNFSRNQGDENSLQLRSIEEQSSYYEPSEASADWSATTIDSILDKNFMPGIYSINNVKYFKVSNNPPSIKSPWLKDNHKIKNNSSSKMGCGCEKAVLVAENNLHGPNYKSRSLDSSRREHESRTMMMMI